MASKQYEMASAYVSILPSLEGLSKELKNQLNSATPQMKKSMDKVFSKTFSGAGKGLSAAFKINDKMFSTIGRGLGNVLSSSVRGAGRTFKEVMTVGAKAAGGALSATLATVGGQIAVGGLTRSLGLNEAEARLKALGFSAKEMEEVMMASSNAIDGTAYAMNESVSAATQFIAAGITEGGELEAVLKNTGKLADMSGRSFADMGSLMSKNASAGIIQWEDMIQLIDAGIPIQSYLAQQMGKTTQEIRAMASAGEITFNDFNRAIDSIEFDSALYASENVVLAFQNVRSQLSKIGATLWEPIIEKMGPILVRVRQGLADLQKMPAFEAATKKIGDKFSKMMEKVSELVDKFFSIFENASNKDVLGSFGNKINAFREKIKGLEGVLAGVGIALSSSFLSNIPIIGGMFGTISLGAGALGGGLAQVYANSEPLRNSISKLIDSFKNLLGTFDGFNADGIAENIGLKLSSIVDSITGFISTLDLSKINIDFSGIFDSIFGNFEDFITTIFNSGDQISASIGKVIDTISSSFSGISAGDQSFGEWLGETVVKAIDFATQIVDVAAPIISGAISALSNVITSDFTSGLFGVLAEFAQWLSGNEVLLLMLGGTLTALFIVGKLSKPLLAMVEFMGAFKKKKGADAGKGGKGGFGIAAFIKEIGNAGLALLTSTPKIIAGIGGITIIAGAITAALKIFDTLGGFDALQETLGKIYGILEEFAAFLGRVFLTIVDAITAGLSAIFDALGLSDVDIMPFIEELGERFSEVVRLIGDTVEVIATTITEGIDALSNLISTLITDFSDFIGVLAEDGWAAGEAAWWLAGGLAALGGALTVFGGGSLIGDLLSGLGSLGNTVLGWFTGKDEGSVAKLGEMAESFGQISEVINALPENWAEMAPQAFEAGFTVIQSFGEGMLNGLNSLTTQMISRVNNMITSLQAQINSRPLNFQMNTVGFAGSAVGMGGVINNNNRNFDVKVSSDSALKSLARSAR